MSEEFVLQNKDEFFLQWKLDKTSQNPQAQRANLANKDAQCHWCEASETRPRQHHTTAEPQCQKFTKICSSGRVVPVQLVPPICNKSSSDSQMCTCWYAPSTGKDSICLIDTCQAVSGTQQVFFLFNICCLYMCACWRIYCSYFLPEKSF